MQGREVKRSLTSPKTDVYFDVRMNDELQVCQKAPESWSSAPARTYDFTGARHHELQWQYDSYSGVFASFSTTSGNSEY